MNLKDFALRIFSVSEGGATVARIQLISGDGGIWNTWTEFPGKDAEDRSEWWSEDAERVVRELQQDLPVQDIQLMFMAYDQAGNQLAQNTKAIRGQAKHANGSTLGGPGRAMADGMNALALTMEKVLATANRQMEHLSTSLAQSNEINTGLLNQLYMAKIQELNSKPAIDPELMNKGLEMLPDLVKMFLVDGRGAGKP